MAKKTNLNPKLINKIKQYISLLKENKIKIDQTLLFGSWAKGNPKPYSDIDICLVSKSFGKNIFEEQVKMAGLAQQIDVQFEPHVFHPSDLKDKYHPLANEIRKYGIVIKE